MFLPKKDDEEEGMFIALTVLFVYTCMHIFKLIKNYALIMCSFSISIIYQVKKTETDRHTHKSYFID